MAGDSSRRGARDTGRARRSDRSWRGRRRARRREREARARAKARRKEEQAEQRARAREAARLAAQPAATAPPPTPEPSADPAPAAPRAELSRTERRLVERQERRKGTVRTASRWAMVGALVVAAAGVGVGVRLATQGDGDGTPDAVAVDDALPDGVDAQPTLLVVTAAEDADPRVADSLILLAHDRRSDESTILLIPTSTVADVPGHGVLPLADALRFGGPALVAATVDNLLGIHVDGVADMSYRDWAGLFSRVGEVEVDVEERLVARAEDGRGEVRFQAGRQVVGPEQAAELLEIRVEGERELDRLPRIQGVLLAHLQAMADPAVLPTVVGDGLPMVDTELERTELAALFTALAGAVVDDRLDVRVLPVRPIGAAGEDGYRPDALRMEALVNDRLQASLPTASREGRSLQVLNGNGLPGIGQSVAEQLVPAGYRVVLTGNADDFDHDKTRIVVYRDTPEQIAIANEIKRLLGVGVIEVSRTPQSVVDVTIVVGADYPPS